MLLSDDREQKLIVCGAQTLAAALLSLAVHSDEADDLIDRLISTPQENFQRFKKKLSSLKHSNRFIDSRQAAGFGRELQRFLQDLKAGVLPH